MISIRDKVKKQLEQASDIEISATWQAKLGNDIAELAKKFKIENFNPKKTVVNAQIVIVYTNNYDEEKEGDKAVQVENFIEAVAKLVGAGENITPRFRGKEIAWQLARKSKKEKASVEVAAASTKKMAAKIAAIAQNMKLTEKQWNSVDKAVRAALFG